MQKQDLNSIIAKYRKLAGSSCDDEKLYRYERFVDHVENNFQLFEEDEYYETEEDLLNDFIEQEAEIDAQWENMFPEGRDDD